MARKPSPSPDATGATDATGAAPTPAILSLSQLATIASQARTATRKGSTASATASDPRPVWSDEVIQVAASLPVPVTLPDRFPAKGPGATLTPRGWVATPRDLSALNGEVCPDRRDDQLLTSIRLALLNDWHGYRLHEGESAANGGILPLPVLFAALGASPELQKARKWAHCLANTGQTCILAAVANVSGRFAILRPDGIRLVRDFYGATEDAAKPPVIVAPSPAPTPAAV